MDKGLEYKIFSSEEGDWYVVAKDGDPEPEILYESHSLDRAYEVILNSLGVKVPIEEREGMEEIGTYIPKKEDFSQ